MLSVLSTNGTREWAFCPSAGHVPCADLQPLMFMLLALNRMLYMRRYGMDRKDGNSLAELMAELGKLEGLHWMRILYAYPSYFSDTLIDEIANNPKVPSTFHGQCSANIWIC